MLRAFVLAGFVLTLAWFLFKPGAVVHGPGQVARSQPAQYELEQKPVIPFGDYRLKPLAGFDIQARVLSREDYRWDSEADLSPTDLALGWGPMSDERVLEDIDISQANRWYFWKTRSFPIPRQQISENSSNMHIIPANDRVRDELKSVRQGDVLKMRGYLIEAQGENGWRWRSSLSRKDTGSRACEVFFVEHLQIKPRP